jgi:hypothetical protein
MNETRLQRPHVPGTGRREAAGMLQHVRMRLEIEAGFRASTLDHLGNAASVNGEPRSRTRLATLMFR